MEPKFPITRQVGRVDARHLLISGSFGLCHRIALVRILVRVNGDVDFLVQVHEGVVHLRSALARPRDLFAVFGSETFTSKSQNEPLTIRFAARS
ncbi:MAG: hypothetical protein AAF368_20915, partial [Planctomycetota bacterium]